MAVYTKGDRGFIGVAGQDWQAVKLTPEKQAELDEQAYIKEAHRTANNTLWTARVIQLAEARYTISDSVHFNREAFNENVALNIAYRANPSDLYGTGMMYRESDFLPQHNSPDAWQALFYAERVAMEQDYHDLLENRSHAGESVHPPLSCEVTIGRVDAQAFYREIRDLRKVTDKRENYNSDRQSPSFNRTNKLVLNFGYERMDMQVLAENRDEMTVQERLSCEVSALPLQGQPRGTGTVSKITLCLQWIKNTGSYPSVLDIERRLGTDSIALALDLTTDQLILRCTDDHSSTVYRIPVDRIDLYSR